MAALEFAYTLTEQEVYDGLRLSKVYKTTGTRAVVETVILGVFFLFFSVSYVLKQEVFSLVMAIVSAVVILALNLVPRFDMKRQAKKGQLDVKLRIYPDKLYAETEKGSQRILLDGSSSVKAVGKERKLVVVQIAEGGLLIIPERAIPKGIRGQVLNFLLQHDKD